MVEKDMVKVSIIICAYNMEIYVNRCLQSLKNQTLSEIEIIFVNDASTDETELRVMEFRDKYDERIVLINNSFNRGLSSSREVGVNKATGKYIMFVDADDWVDITICEKLYKRAEALQAEIVFSGLCHKDDRGTVFGFPTFMPENYFSFSEGRLIREQKIAVAIRAMHSYWGKLYLKEFWDRSEFHPLRGINYNEDIAVVFLILLAERFAYVNEELYVWYFRPNSMSAARVDNMKYREETAKLFLEEGNQLHLYPLYGELIEYFYINYNYIEAIYTFINFKEDDDFDLEKISKLSKAVKEEKIDIQRNYYYNVLVDNTIKEYIEILQNGTPEEFVKKYYEEYRLYYEVSKEAIVRLLNDYAGKTIYLWGAGKKTRTFLKVNKRIVPQIKGIIDSNRTKQGTSIYGVPVLSYEEIDMGVCLVMNEKHLKKIQQTVGMNIELINLDAYIKYGIIN